MCEIENNEKENFPQKEKQKRKSRNKWTVESAQLKVDEIKKDSYKVLETFVKDGNAHLRVKCLICDYEFSPSVRNFLRGSGCNKCHNNNKLPTLQMISELSYEKYGNKYEILKTFFRKREDGFNESCASIKCNGCGIVSDKTIVKFIGGERGCINCAHRAPITLSSLISRGTKINGVLYDYSLIKPSDIKNAYSKVKIFCNECLGIFEQTIHGHLNAESGCPNCKKSKGEKFVKNYLENKLKFSTQFKIIPNADFPCVRNFLFVNFYFKYKNKKYIIKINGEQHYKLTLFGGHDTKEIAENKFEKIKKRDIWLEQYCKRRNIVLITINTMLNKKQEQIIKFLEEKLLQLNVI